MTIAVDLGRKATKQTNFHGFCIKKPKDTNQIHFKGAQWLSGRVLDSRPRGRELVPHRRHCVVVLEQDTFILA